MTVRSTYVARRLLVLIVVLGAVFLLLTSVGAADEPPPPTQTHVVGSGDTLWAIASVYTPAGDDVRPLIEAISATNELDSGTIHPGQALRIPILP